MFNLSLGHAARRYLKDRQHPWALLLDELARSLDVVFVISAGNVSAPTVPSAATSRQLQAQVLEQLLTDDHALIDPASAMLALSVGSIARTDKPFKDYKDDGKRKPLVGAPPLGPSPFTRAGRVAETGAGPEKAIKPELVAYGGNCLLDFGCWLSNDALLGELSLNLLRAPTERPLKATTGTSVAAPYITHICARVEHTLKQLSQWRQKAPSANLVRALTVHSAIVPTESAKWVDPIEKNVQRQLRLLGYGMPDPARALRSTDQRVVLLAEDELEDESYHIYELDIPAPFVKSVLSATFCTRPFFVE